jgi:hypothetical protein
MFLGRKVTRELLRRKENGAVYIAGFKPQREIWIGRYVHFSATKAQTAFWDFVSDAENKGLLEIA